MMDKFDCQIITEPSERHSHSYAQLLIPLDQPLAISIDDREHTVGPHDLCFIAAHAPHQCPGSGLAVNIPAEMLSIMDHLALSVRPVFPQWQELEPTINLLKSEIIRDPADNAIRLLCIFLLERLRNDASGNSIRYLRGHFAEPLRVNQLAAIEGYNTSYYSEWLKKQTGLSPGQYLRQLRMDRARELLRTTAYGIEEIAGLVGYDSHSSFTRAFRRLVGLTPNQYRHLPRNK